MRLKSFSARRAGRLLKSVTAVLLAAGLALPPGGTLPAVSGSVAFAAGKLTKTGMGTYLLFDGTSTVSGVLRRGIDLSHWQGDVDWKKAAADDVSFAMLGTRYKGEVDPFFREHAEEAVDAGIEIGVYIYSYAMTPAEAEAEADFVLDLVKDCDISYPIAFDVEDLDSQGTLTKEERTEIILAFFKKIRAAGYYPILYANDYWLKNMLDMEALSGCPVWAAAYGRQPEWQDYVMWQGAEDGTVDGVTGGVDIDLQFKSFRDHIPADTWRTIGGKSYYYSDYRIQKDTLVNDGKGIYYMDSDGTAVKGWKTVGGKKYYFSEPDGKAYTGWKKFGNDWNYFGGSGVLATGWVNDGGVWYYMDGEGAMQRGWITAGGKKYYLSDSGAMLTGIREIGGRRYALGSDGAMKTNVWAEENGAWYYMGGDGASVTGWNTVNGTDYYMGADGRMATGWLLVNGVWYYFGNSGAKHTGVISDGGVLYDLGESGAMRTDTYTEYNGVLYVVGPDGVMRPMEEDGSQAGSAESAAAGAAASAEESSVSSGSGSVSAGNAGTVSAQVSPGEAVSVPPVTESVSYESAEAAIAAPGAAAEAVIAGPGTALVGASASPGGMVSAGSAPESDSSSGVVLPNGL